MTWPSFINTLWWPFWAVLAAIPPLIILLYFLKLKRQPLEVPSTYLWHKSIEDLHVNSIWQRLRRNLLLFLQLLILLLVALALLRPNWEGKTLEGNRFIFLIDNSASMSAADQRPSRLEEAKRLVAQQIDRLESGDVAMLISFSDSARVEQTFTDNRSVLRNSLEEIRPTSRTTSLLEALKVASSLANPGQSAFDSTDQQVADALPANLLIYSDGNFDPVKGFSLGNLEPVFVPIGDTSATNVGILDFSVGRSEIDPSKHEAFARLGNFGDEDVVVDLDLFLDDDEEEIDAAQLEIAAGEEDVVVFHIGEIETGTLHLKIGTKDDLALDNEAWVVISAPRHAEILLATPGNEPLELALRTPATIERANVTIQPPEFLKDPKYQAAVAAGTYDLVIYDRCTPESMPQANSLFIGSLPPIPDWQAEDLLETPVILDWETGHPLLQWIDLTNVTLVRGTPIAPPEVGSVLIDSNLGPMMAIAPRESYEDLVMGFVLLDQELDENNEPEIYVGTDWWERQSFPVFVFNLVDYLGGNQGRLGSESVQPGGRVSIDNPDPKANLRVNCPGGQVVSPRTGTAGKLSFGQTNYLGVYDVTLDQKTIRQFAVNLFDRSESDIAPPASNEANGESMFAIQIGHVKVAGQAGWEESRRELWKLLLGLGLVVLILEWYIYNRRVYL